MKKIFSLLAIVCAFASCDPIHEDIANASGITIDELKAMTTVKVDEAPGGQTGNVITCSTSAPVNAKWLFDGKALLGNYAKKKMTLGDHTVTLAALCADGSEISVEYPITCQAITDPLTKYYIYGPDAAPLVMTKGDAAAGRFSDNEGKGLPYLTDDVYFGKKTLIFDIIAEPGDDGLWDGSSGPALVRVMNGWWGATYADDLILETGLWELPLTDAIAADCAKGGEGKDLDILVRRGTVTIKSVYYEE